MNQKMIVRRKSLIIICYLSAMLIIIFSSCDNIKYKVNKLYEITLNNTSIRVLQIKNESCLDSTIFCYFDPQNYSIKFATIVGNKINIDRIQLHKTIAESINNNLISTSNQLFCVSKDSILYFDSDSCKVYCINGKGDMKYVSNLPSEKHPALISGQFVSKKGNDYLYTWIPKKEGSFGEVVSRKLFYKTHKPICRVNLKFEKIVSSSIFGIYPPNYIETGKNFYDYFPNICLGENNLIILSYGADNELYIFKDSTLIKSVECKSKYIKKFNDISDSQFKNFSFLKKYLFEEPRYIKLIYNPFKKQYYRIVKHKFDIEDNTIKNKYWSLLILDDQFTTLDEIEIKYSDYLPDIIIPSKYGIYLQSLNTNPTSNSKNFILSLVNFDKL